MIIISNLNNIEGIIKCFAQILSTIHDLCDTKCCVRFSVFVLCKSFLSFLLTFFSCLKLNKFKIIY